jgi:hypothetical protein
LGIIEPWNSHTVNLLFGHDRAINDGLERPVKAFGIEAA